MSVDSEPRKGTHIAPEKERRRVEKRQQDTHLLLEVERLAVTFHTPLGSVHGVRDASLKVRRGEILGLVGESGSGKSTLSFALMGYLPPTAVVDGTIRFEGRKITEMPPDELRRLRGNRIAMVHQDPATSLNPTMRVGSQVEEVLRFHLGLNTKLARVRTAELFESVGLAEPELLGRRYPHQLSGGMQQRVVIAMALACDPSLLILDEPTSNLDVTTEATILDLVQQLRERVSGGVVFVTHNLGVIARIADRVAVMYAGQVIEQGPVADLFRNPKHPYTLGLLNCVPPPPGKTGQITDLQAIPGSIYPGKAPTMESCLFADRCPLAKGLCREKKPGLFDAGVNRQARCYFWEEVRPGIWGKDKNRVSAGPATERSSEQVLSVRNLSKCYPEDQRKYLLFGPPSRPPLRAVAAVSFDVEVGQTLGIVGESGSGKTTIARAIAGLTPRSGGEMDLLGEHLAPKVEQRSDRQLAALRMVFQNPTSSLNPKLPVGRAIMRALQKFSGMSRQESREHGARLLQAVGLDPSYLDRLPGELSGGERQRVALAGAFATNPRLLVADEPVSALDVSVQAQVLELLINHQSDTRMSYIFISHDLGVVGYISHAILVVYAGYIVESGPAESVLSPPYHPYTEALLSVVPTPDPKAGRSRIRLEGAMPTRREQFRGCCFSGRCPRKQGDICEEVPPPARTDPHVPGHVVYCHIPLEELRAIQHGLE